MISVITPCLNIIKDGREEYLHKMMKSVHEQTYANIQHIFIDGDSCDGTLELLEEYKQRGWIDILISKKDSGIYQALNRGLKLAKGEYVNIMNTDDYLLDKDFFKNSIQILENDCNFDFVHADKIIKSRDNDEVIVKKGDEKVAFFRMPYRHQTMIIKKKVYDDLGFYIPKIHICALDGGISSNKELCIKEVTQILYDSYGEKYNLTLDDCKNIYTRKKSLKMFIKILFKVKNKRIKQSLLYYFNPKSKKLIHTKLI